MVANVLAFHLDKWQPASWLPLPVVSQSLLRGYRHARSPQRVARTAGKSHSRLHFAHSTRTISAEGCAHSRQIALSPAFRALDTHDLRRGSRAQLANRTLACVRALDTHDLRRGLRAQPANRTPQSARSQQIALSPAFRALDTHDLRRGLRAQPANRTLRLHFAHSTRTISAEGCARSRQIRTLACISRTRHARSPQRVARTAGKSHSRLHFAHSTRTISAEGCARSRQIALSPAFRALDTHDLRRGLRGHPAHRTLACISRTRHARSPQRVARAPGTSHSRLHFAHSTRTISAEGCAGTPGTSHSRPAFRALDTHDLRRGLHFRLMLFVPPSAFKREFISGEMFFIRISPVLVFHTHPYSHLPAHCMLAYSTLAYHCILTLAYHAWHTYTCIL